MALTIKEIPDSRQMIGPSCVLASFIFAPGSSDYVTGGYVISASALGLGHIYAADTAGLNAASNGTYYVMTLAQTNPPSPGLTQVKLQAFVAATGAEVANAANLSGHIIVGQIWGY